MDFSAMEVHLQETSLIQREEEVGVSKTLIPRCREKLIIWKTMHLIEEESGRKSDSFPRQDRLLKQ